MNGFRGNRITDGHTDRDLRNYCMMEGVQLSSSDLQLTINCYVLAEDNVPGSISGDLVTVCTVTGEGKRLDHKEKGKKNNLYTAQILRTIAIG